MEFKKSVREEISIFQAWLSAPSIYKWIYIDDWQAYFDAVSNLENYFLYSVYLNGELIAQISAEMIDGCAAICLIVAPSKQGQGLGRTILCAMIAKSRTLFGAICRYRAHIFRGNTASLRCFEASGFRYIHTGDDGEDIYGYDLV